MPNVQLREKVKEWLDQFSHEARALPSTMHLEELSRYLVGFKSNTIEVLSYS